MIRTELLDKLKRNQKVQAFLAQIPEKMLAECAPMVLTAGTMVLKKDERVTYAYLLLTGELMIVNEMPDGNFYSWSTMTGCDFVCDLEVLSGIMTSVANVTAVEDCAVLRLGVERFSYYMDTEHRFLKLVAACLAKKLYASSYERGNEVYKDAVSRVAIYLLRYYCQYSPRRGERTLVRRTRPMIAGELGISLRTVNRSVAALKDGGYIAIQYGKITMTPSQYGRMLERWDKSGEALNQFEIWRKLR